MITEDARTFFVNGHKCEIEYARREHYKGYIDGEEITSSHSPTNIRKTLIQDAKYRVEVEPDFEDVLNATLNFIKQQHDHSTGSPIWVYNGVVMDNVTPLDSVGPAYRAVLILRDEGYIEEGQIAMDLNVESMWRYVGEE